MEGIMMLHLFHGSAVQRGKSAGRINKAVRRLAWAMESITWPLRAPFLRYRFSRSEPLGLTIGITTYMDRFESCLKPVLSRIASLFPGEQVIVIANGHYLEDNQRSYIDRFRKFCSRFGNVEEEAYLDPRGLSSLWNRIIEKAGYPKILILNDDIILKPGFRPLIKQILAGDNPVVTINSSWSHFVISRDTIASVGLFDEGLKEIGGEDDDYLARMAIAGIRASDVASGTVSGRSKRRMKTGGLNSYGRDMSREAGGYSTLNTGYLLNKWETSDTFFEGAVEVQGRKRRYWKRRNTMEDQTGYTTR